MKNLLLILLLVYISGCAVVVHPSGGAKDAEPPILTQSEPKNYSTHFSGNKLVLSFNEYIQLSDPGKILISPSVGKKWKALSDKKRIVLTFDTTLQSNTTYTVEFFDNIVDINEANKVKLLKIIFSTGNVIDSGSIAGKAVNPMNNLVPESAYAALLPASTVFSDTITQFVPSYLSKVSASGEFAITNLPQQSFHLFVFEDKNQNLAYDPGELAAYTDSLIMANDSNEHLLKLFEPINTAKAILLNAVSENTFKTIVRIKNATPEANLVANREITVQTTPDSMIVFHNDTINKNLDLILQDKGFTDTLVVKINNKAPDSLRIKIDNNLLKELFDTLTITLNNPVKQTDSTKINLLADSTLLIPVRIQPTAQPLNYRIIYPKEEKRNYTLLLGTGAFKDIYESDNQNDTINFTTKSADEYGNISFLVNRDSSKSEQIILELLTDITKGTVWKSVIANTKETVHFYFLPPATYTLRITLDKNRNNRYDSGLLFKQQPEQTYIYSTDFKVRAGWEINDIIINIPRD